MYQRKSHEKKNKLLRDLSMFGSFMGVSGFVYLFHVFQNEPSVRGYLAAASLMVAYVFQFQTYDYRMRQMWSCFFAWVVYSSVFYDIRTHWYGLYRFLRHLCFAFFPLAAATKHLRKGFLIRGLFWVIIVAGPEISSNVYGNALFSILRVFACTVIIMTRVQDSGEAGQHSLEEFVWVFFCHETLLSIVVVQLLFDFLPIELQGAWPFVRNTKKNVLPSDVIGENDVPFIGHRGIIGAKRLSP